MSGLNASLRRQIALNTLNFIVEKVLLCLNMMRDDCSDASTKLCNREPDICNYLFCNYLNNDDVVRNVGLDDFRFFSEAPENYTNNKPVGRVDFQVFSINEFRHRNRYFIVECKRIDGNLTLNREYIDEGMRRFVGEASKYSSYYNMNCMLGFLVKKIDVSANIDKINTLLKTDYSDMLTYEYLYAGQVQDTFVSSHGSGEPRIELIHAFSDCSSIIE